MSLTTISPRTLLFFRKEDFRITGREMQASRTIWLSNVHCDGDEPHIYYCRNNGWGIQVNSSQEADVIVSCQSNSDIDDEYYRNDFLPKFKGHEDTRHHHHP